MHLVDGGCLFNLNLLMLFQAYMQPKIARPTRGKFPSPDTTATTIADMIGDKVRRREPLANFSLILAMLAGLGVPVLLFAYNDVLN